MIFGDLTSLHLSRHASSRGLAICSRCPTCASAQSSTSRTFPAPPRDNKAASCRVRMSRTRAYPNALLLFTTHCSLFSAHGPRFTAAIKLVSDELLQQAGVRACKTCLHLACHAGTPLQACQEARLGDKGPGSHFVSEMSVRPPPHHLHAVRGNPTHVGPIKRAPFKRSLRKRGCSEDLTSEYRTHALPAHNCSPPDEVPEKGKRLQLLEAPALQMTFRQSHLPPANLPL